MWLMGIERMIGAIISHYAIFDKFGERDDAGVCASMPPDVTNSGQLPPVKKNPASPCSHTLIRAMTNCETSDAPSHSGYVTPDGVWMIADDVISRDIPSLTGLKQNGSESRCASRVQFLWNYSGKPLTPWG